MASVSRTLARIKEDLDPFLPEESILSACRQLGHEWRERALGPVQTVHLFVVQMLCFNTAMTHLRHLAHMAVSTSAYCRARMRLPLAVLEALLDKSSEAMRTDEASADGLWCGLRACLVDGSSTIAPDTPDSQEAFGQPKGCKKDCSFPIPKILGLFDAFSGLMLKTLSFPLYTHEQSKVWMLHPLLKIGDLLVGDRGFCSYVHLTMLFSRGIHGLFRIHQKQIVDFRPHRKYRRKYPTGRKVAAEKMPRSKFIRRLGKHDQVVEWFKDAIARPKWMGKEQFQTLPDSLQVRELRFVLPRKGQRTRCITIATTLLDPLLYPKEKIAELYGVRWQVETHFTELKTTLNMRRVKSQTAEGVRKELVVYALVYNLVHMVMVRAAQRQGVMPRQISFIDTIRWLLCAAPGEPLTDLLVNLYRPDRHEPIVVKNRESNYTKMTRPRRELQKALKQAGKSA
jgi:hypothetical protein